MKGSDMSQYTVRTSVKFRGKEVRQPVLRVLLGSFLAIIWLVGMLLWFITMILYVAVLVALSPVLILIHFVLRATGRVGFVYRSPGKVRIVVSATGFRDASSVGFRKAPTRS
jgi:Flp pilus assembly protein TadB